MASKVTGRATEGSEMISTLTQLFNEKIDPIKIQLEKLHIKETSVWFRTR